MDEKENYYQMNFNEIKALGKGAFSTVFKASLDNKNFAIKKIPFEDNTSTRIKTLKEIDFISKLNSDYVVKYIQHWIEFNYYLRTENKNKKETKLVQVDSMSLLYDPSKSLLLHIQTELCSLTLSDVIPFLITNPVLINSINLNCYNIASNILSQLLECVDYLHNYDPPIIHRDLKPENIMLIDTMTNKCVKLLDFGLSTYHEFVDQSHTKYLGTMAYRAHELNGKKYGTKADIYSLGVIMQNIFNIDINEDSNHADEIIKIKYEYIIDLCIKCLENLSKKRPTCKQILEDKNLWESNTSSASLYAEITQIVNERNQKIFENKFEDKKYEKEFIEIQQILVGSYGVFYKVRELSNDKCYAIKRIKFTDLKDQSTKDDEQYKKILSKLTCWQNLNISNILKFESIWVEYVEYNIHNKFERIPTWHIKTELFLLTLEQAIKQISYELNIINQSYITPVNLFLTLQIFTKISDCLNYLHHQSPPIKHGNLNLNNIFISEDMLTGSVKVGETDLTKDFGQEIHKNQDLLDLGKILQKLLSFDLNFNLNCAHKLVIESSFKEKDHFNFIFEQLCILIENLNCFSDNKALTITNVVEEINKIPLTFQMVEKTLSIKYVLSSEISTLTSKLVKCFNFENATENKPALTQKHELIFKKWPLFESIQKNLMDNIKHLFILEKSKEKAIYSAKDETSYSVTIRGHLDNNDFQTKYIDELSNLGIKCLVNGDSHVIILTKTNEVFSFGNNEFGQLGNETYLSNNKPKLINLKSELIKDVKSGAFFNTALTDSGKLYSWGRGDLGQLGNNSTSNLTFPTIIEEIYHTIIESISCGYNHSLALSKNGNVYGWGYNEFGQIGNGNNENQLKPKLIDFNKKFKKISCGRVHSLLLSKDGHIYAFCYNKFGQLGTGSFIDQNNPVKLSIDIIFVDIETTYCDYISIGLSIENKYYFWGKGGPNFPLVANFQSIYDIFLLYTEKKTFYRSIFRDSFQNEQEFENILLNLNLFKYPKEIIPIISFLSLVFMKESQALIVTNDDLIYTMRVSPSIDNTSAEPIELKPLSIIKVEKINYINELVFLSTKDKKLITFVYSQNPMIQSQFLTHLNQKEIKPVYICRNADSLVFLSELGNVYTFAYNIITETTSNKQKFIFVSSGLNHFIAIDQNNDLYGWGVNRYGQLGINSFKDQESPLCISLDNFVIKKVCCGRYHTLLLNYDGEIYSFGLNNFGQLGHNDQIVRCKPIKIKSSIKFIDIEATFCDDISCALAEDGQYYLWGDCDAAISYPTCTELMSFDAIFIKFSKHRFTANQITLNYNII